MSKQMQEQQIDELVALIDDFVSGHLCHGRGGHMNVQVNDQGAVKTQAAYVKTITTSPALDGLCCNSQLGNLSCQTPTLLNGPEDWNGF